MKNQYSTDAVRKRYLAPLAFEHTDRLDRILNATKPVWVVDDATPFRLFRATLGSPNTITIGNKALIRLEVHCHASAVLLTTLSKESLSLTQKEKKEQSAVANELFGWVAYHDLTAPNRMIAAVVGEQIDVMKIGKRKLTEKQRLEGTAIFQSATAFILMHELRHLEQNHEESTIEIERETDSFAARWLCEAATTGSLCEVERILTLFGIASALCWLTVPEIHFGPVASTTHPFAYNRLYQTLDEVINSSDAEHHFVWFLVKQILLTHMNAARFEFRPDDELWKSEDSKAVVNYLIDRISRHEKQLSALD